MKEIMMPVLVMDDDCMKCEDLDIESSARTRIYAGYECVNQDVIVKCSSVYKCERLKKRMEKKHEQIDDHR